MSDNQVTATEAPAIPQVRRVIRWPDACALTCMSRMQLTRLIRRGQFVEPILLSEKAIGFFEDEVAGWIESRPRRLAKNPRERTNGR